jgi:hypothetical protein
MALKSEQIEHHLGNISHKGHKDLNGEPIIKNSEDIKTMNSILCITDTRIGSIKQLILKAI